ncbi:hypothetical protein BMS3Abin17_00393 [archaeon BMS3Abin17]|nr:hypothetical protein BMS3Abin17_00393 [archaeon BMS3Abin17]HDZ60256.1 hypothetical protein [Candidatus Pacearchaeota archaeon]
MTQNIERQIIELIATDRIYIPISSMNGKLYRTRPKLGKALGLSEGDSFEGERVCTRVEEGEQLKARTMKEAIDKFCEEYTRHGKILRGYIEEKRDEREVNLTFGMNEGCRLTEVDYMSVMKNLGYTDALAQKTLPGILDYSRRLSKKRDEERSVLIG